MPGGIRLNKRAAADISTPPADKITLYFDDTDGPAFKDESGTVIPLEGAPGADGTLTYLDHGNTGSTETVTASAADIHRLVANAATVTLTLTGWPASGTPGIIRLWLEQDVSGGRDWVFPGSVDFGDPGEPDWTARSGGAVDLVDLMTVDGGTTIIATIGGREGPTGAAGADATIDYGEDADITTQDYDDVADSGVSTEVARADHLHGMPSAGSGGGPPDCYEAFLSTPITMVNASTYYSSSQLAITPAAGDYLAVASICISSASNSITYEQLQISKGGSIASNVLTGQTGLKEVFNYTPANNGSGGLTLAAQARVTCNGTDVVRVAGYTLRGSSDGTILDTTLAGGTADKATSLTLTRITSI